MRTHGIIEPNSDRIMKSYFTEVFNQMLKNAQEERFE